MMNKKDKEYLLGQSVGLEESSKFLLEVASNFFQARKDNEANLIRDLAIKLQLKSNERYEHPKP